MKASETAQQRSQRVCGMFLDWWRRSRVDAERILLVGTNLNLLAKQLEDEKRVVQWWSWFPEDIEDPVSFPTNEQVDAAIIRIPPEKDRLKLVIEVVASRLKPGGAMWLFGANDEGIKSVSRLGPPFFSKGITLDTRRHARVVGFDRLSEGNPRHQLTEFALSANLCFGESTTEWVYFPGTFAKGKLDTGSRLLLEAVAHLPQVARLLDLGCGTGILSGFSQLGREMHALDRDALALAATKINVPHAHLHGQIDGSRTPRFPLISFSVIHLFTMGRSRITPSLSTWWRNRINILHRMASFGWWCSTVFR